MNFLKKSIFFLFLISIFLWACSRESDPTPQPAPADQTTAKVVNYVWEKMKTDYLWNKEMPQLDIKQYADPVKLVTDLRHKTLDRWSYIVKDEGKIYNQIVQGTAQGSFGFSLGWEGRDQSLRVRYVQPKGSPAQAGMTRGSKILKINGSGFSYGQSIVLPDACQIEFVNADGKVQTATISRTNFQNSAILHQEIKTIGGKKVAYLLFNEFTEPAIEELEKAIQMFKAEQATDLILDLRYNGGGMLKTAAYLGSFIVPEKAMGQTFFKYEYNSNLSSKNIDVPFVKLATHYPFQNIVIIQTTGTASASELIINGLRPFTNMKLVGTNSHGKFCGGSIEVFEGHTFAPITFKLSNSQGVSDFVNGFAPDLQATDDLRYNFGDTQESMLRAAFQALQISLPAGGRTEKLTATEGKVVYDEAVPNLPLIIQK